MAIRIGEQFGDLGKEFIVLENSGIKTIVEKGPRFSSKSPETSPTRDCQSLNLNPEVMSQYEASELTNDVLD